VTAKIPYDIPGSFREVTLRTAVKIVKMDGETVKRSE
jgi:hypothetical protein